MGIFYVITGTRKYLDLQLFKGGYVNRVPDRPIIESLLDIDFYKLTMLQMIFHLHKNVPVNFSFLNRTKAVRLGDVIDHGQLREELEHCQTLRFRYEEIEYLREIKRSDNSPMFSSDFLLFLEDFRLPDFYLGIPNEGQLNLHFGGAWSRSTLWETLSMSIVNELYNRHLTSDFSRVFLDAVEGQGRINLARKVFAIQLQEQVTFSDFGTRRRFSREWQDYVVGVLTEEFPRNQFLGTSNVFLAKKYGVKPIGTNAHELPMAYTGIYFKEDEKDPTYSQKQVPVDWENEYGLDLSIFLPDTFGTDWFLRKVVTERQLLGWKGSRQDSADPLSYAEKWIKKYESFEIDPMNKLIVFADGLVCEKIVEISHKLEGRIGCSFGWGTDLTNDMGFDPISIVTKVTHANGYPVAKLSDNIEKATGPIEAVERMKSLVGYTNTFSEACKV